jgi:hypothetical protein
MLVFNCYVCLEVRELSPRGRCVKCEYDRSIANELEVERLESELAKYTGEHTSENHC